MSRNNDYITGNLLDYLYHQKYYKLICIDLSRQTQTSIPQQITNKGKLREDNGARTFFVAGKQQKNYSKLFFRFINCQRIIKIVELQKILNLLNQPHYSKFITRKWNIVNDQ